MQGLLILFMTGWRYFQPSANMATDLINIVFLTRSVG